jgi:mTERF domain-containing protein
VALVSTEARFLQVYVLPHADELPDVLRAMKGEIPFEGFDGSKEKRLRARKKKMSA